MDIIHCQNQAKEAKCNYKNISMGDDDLINLKNDIESLIVML